MYTVQNLSAVRERETLNLANYQIEVDKKGNMVKKSVVGQRPFNRHLCKTDTATCQKTGVGPCALLFSHFTVSKLYEAGTSLRRTVDAGPDGLRLIR